MIRKIRTIDPDMVSTAKSAKGVEVPPEMEVDPGAHFWLLTNNKQDLQDATYYSTQIEGGRDIYILYHGQEGRDPKILNNKILFTDPSRE